MSGPEFSASAASQTSSNPNYTGEMAKDGHSTFEHETAREKSLHEEASRLNIRAEDLDVFLRNGLSGDRIPKNPQIRKMQLNYLKRHETPTPKWIAISGFYPEAEASYPWDERRRRVGIIYRAAILLIRRALKRAEMDAINGERTVFWDPVVEVCRGLEISQSKLSAYCKEFSGNSLTQVIDVVRAERVRKMMRAEVREFLEGLKRGVHGQDARATFALGATLGEGVSHRGKLEKLEVWGELRASRKGPEFDWNMWAQGFGFASYRRMYRACQVRYKMTPRQMEIQLIEECLAALESGEVKEKEEEFEKNPLVTLEVIEECLGKMDAGGVTG